MRALLNTTLAITIIASLGACVVEETGYDDDDDSSSSSSSSSSENGSGSGSSASGGAAVKAGDPCTSDSQCGTGRCLDSLLPGGPRYCAASCNVHDDCAVMFEADSYYNYGIPPDLQPGNAYNSDSMTRVLMGCVDPAEYPTMGAADGNTYCGMVCPLNAAAVWNDEGAVVACRCLPNYRDADPADDRMNCVWDESVECSLFRPECNASNTDVSECSAGNFSCVVDEGLEGFCYDFVTGADIEACVYEECSDSQCDTDCLQSCGGTPTCVDACCSC